MPRRTRRARERSVDLTRYREIIPEWERFVDASARPEPTVFRVRTGRVSESALCERLERQGFRLRPLPGQPTFHQVEEAPFPVSLTLEHWQGLIYVQQASTGVAPPALGAQPGERVLDLCSAPGGKTTHLAELMEDRGCLVACEIDEKRIRGLLGNVYRLGHPNVLVVSGDGRRFPEGALFDRVLVDAPCSGEGTLRRRSGEPPDQSSAFLAHITATQRALLEKAVRLTRPGGTILYVTCTFSPEENEAVVSDVLASAPVELEPLDLPVPHAPGITSFAGARYDARLEGAARIYPHHLDSGGLFLAKLVRLGEGGRGDGWSSVPAAFPDDGMSEEEASRRVGGALDVLRERYGIDPGAHPDWRWTMRGGRAWLHTVGEWPVGAWEGGSWRPVSVGQRSIEFDSRDRPRPTNDFLRMVGAGVTHGIVDLSRAELESALRGETVEAEPDVRGPVVLRYRGEVVGRGATTPGGVASEIPKARAADLRRILAGR